MTPNAVNHSFLLHVQTLSRLFTKFKALCRRLLIILITKKSARNSLASVFGLLALITTVIKLKKLRKSPLNRKNSIEFDPLKSGDLNRRESHVLVIKYGKSIRRIPIKYSRTIIFASHRPLFLDDYGRQLLSGSMRHVWTIQFSAILDIIWPSLRCKVSALIATHIALLVTRTWLSIAVARNDGFIARQIITLNSFGLFKGILLWFLIGIPASYTNSAIYFLQAQISQEFRTRFTRYVHDLYLSDRIPFYKRSLVQADSDFILHSISSDIPMFCETLSQLFSLVGKPVLDLLIFGWQLTNILGVFPLFIMWITFISSARILRKITPSFMKISFINADSEAKLRRFYSQLLAYSEEIMFYNGSLHAYNTINKLLGNVRQQSSLVAIRILKFEIVQIYMTRYFWNAIGLLLFAIPSLKVENGQILFVDNDFNSPDDHNFEVFSIARRYMVQVADSGSILMKATKKFAEFKSCTHRVYSLLSLLHHLNSPYFFTNQEGTSKYSFKDVNGTIQQGFDGIRIENVPIVTPKNKGASGELICEPLNLTIVEGQHLLISGSNASGKTSVMRVISGLWPVYRGLISKPSHKEIMFLPQKAYLPVGTLRDQVTYPHRFEIDSISSEADVYILSALKSAHLGNLVEREGGLESRKDWTDVLSGGEKQRICMARIFYHRPRFVIIDEGTSAMNADVEGSIYLKLKQLSITIITISHRPTLLKYHKNQLEIGVGPDSRQWKLHSIERGKSSLSSSSKSLENYMKSDRSLEEQIEILKRRQADLKSVLFAVTT